METPPLSLKDQGSQALRNGDLDTAVDCLARAVMMDDADADAKALLAVAYSQKGLHAQAKRAMESAVARQPQNPNYRFNLGVVLERAGDMQGAAIAYRDTLQANPQHEQAKSRLAAMGPQAQALLANAPKPLEPIGVPAYNQPPSDPLGTPTPPPVAPISPPPPPAPPSYGSAPVGQATSPFAPPPPPSPSSLTVDAPFAPPPIGQAGGSPFAAPPPPAAPITAQAPPGTVQCPRCGQFSRIGMTCEFCSAPMAPPPRPVVSQAPQPYVTSGFSPGGGFGGGVVAKSHRGGMLLTLALLGLVCSCLPTAIIAWILGNQDMAEINSGLMDPSGRGITQASRVIGMIGTGWGVLQLIYAIVMIFAAIGTSGAR